MAHYWQKQVYCFSSLKQYTENYCDRLKSCRMPKPPPILDQKRNYLAPDHSPFTLGAGSSKLLKYKLKFWVRCAWFIPCGSGRATSKASWCQRQHLGALNAALLRPDHFDPLTPPRKPPCSNHPLHPFTPKFHIPILPFCRRLSTTTSDILAPPQTCTPATIAHIIPSLQ